MPQKVATLGETTVGKAGGLFKSIVGSASLFTVLGTDILAPVDAHLGLFVGLTVLLLSLTTVCLVRPGSQLSIGLRLEAVTGFVHRVGRNRAPRHWPGPIALALGVLTAALVLSKVATSVAPSDGWIGSHVSAVRSVQGTLGVVDPHTQRIDQTTQAIKKDTSTIIAKLGGLKKETSSDPREELANLGVEWSTENFVEALETGDSRTVKLFLAGGMSPTVLDKGASAVLFILQPSLPDPIPMLKLLIAAGYDVNANLLDTYIMPSYGDGTMTFPPYFVSKDLPADYGPGSFDGPALFWIVIRAAWFGPTKSVLNVIAFLRQRGADTNLARQFLHSPGWDTPDTKSLRAALGG